MSHDMTSRELADSMLRRVWSLKGTPDGFARASQELEQAFDAHAVEAVRRNTLAIRREKGES